MRWDRIEGNWKQYSARLKERWSKLSDDDIATIQGKREQLEGKLREAYGLERDQAAKDVDEFCGGVERAARDREARD